ncbi:MAG: hypothetical protein QOF60_1310 [Actinomycetota bacterium]|nr:hypothetical protein [Actinomycetota bacterium]
MSRRRLFLRLVCFAVAGALVAASPAGAIDPRSKPVVDKAIAFIASQQNADGGFGDAPDTETPDAALAIADAAQRTTVYDKAAALAAVRSVAKGGNSALHYLDDLSAKSNLSVGKAAEIVMVAASVGLNPAAFDPDGDGAVDLVAKIDASKQSNGSYAGTYYFTVQVALVQPLLGRPVAADTLAYLRAGQRADGGYNFNGDQATGSFDGSDTDITSLVVQALAAAGVAGTDAGVRRALDFLATQQNADGGFKPSFSTDSNPGSTRGVVLALAAAGFDPLSTCWRGGSSPAGVKTPDDYLRAQQAASGRIGEDTGFAATQYTSQAVQGLVRNFQPVVRASAVACATTGYRLVGSDGGVFAHGGAGYFGSTGDVVLNKPIVASAPSPSGRGYWLFASDGGVFAFGDAPFVGSLGDVPLNKPIVGAAATPTGGGYWLFGSDGGVFSFGDAPFLGSLGDVSLNKPIVGAVASPSGRGYWLFASDGGVFAFGDAAFFGSTGDRSLNKPVVAGAPSRSGRGYWLFASDGGVFAFGDAAFFGSTGDRSLNKPIVAGVASRGDGYYLVASDGGVFAFGDAPFFGSEGDRSLSAPIVSVHR